MFLRVKFKNNVLSWVIKLFSSFQKRTFRLVKKWWHRSYCWHLVWSRWFEIAIAATKIIRRQEKGERLYKHPRSWDELVFISSSTPTGGGNELRVVSSHCDEIWRALHLDDDLLYCVQEHNRHLFAKLGGIYSIALEISFILTDAFSGFDCKPDQQRS